MLIFLCVCALHHLKVVFCLQDNHLSAFGVILDSGICVTLQRQTAVRMSCVMWELVKQVNYADVQFLPYSFGKPVSLCYSA